MSNVSGINYQGPERSYQAPLGQLFNVKPKKQGVHTLKGYADLEGLMRDLDIISAQSAAIYKECENQLSNFALAISPENKELIEAHDIVYPGQTPDYIAFNEYKYLLTKGDNHAAQYIKKHYEKKVRGPKGTNALDVSHIALAIHAEVRRIRDFIQTYIGELDETAEFRTIELFQDWGQDATHSIQKLWKAITGEVSTKISQSELDQVDGSLSSKYQALFQTKLNQLNKYIEDILEEFDQNWDHSSDYFYNKILGPGLQFHIKIASDLTDTSLVRPDKMPILTREANNTIQGLAVNYSVALDDQIKRNKLFEGYISKLYLDIHQRDTYKNYMAQLEQKGSVMKAPFTHPKPNAEPKAFIETPHPLTHKYVPSHSSDQIHPSHYDLFDREDANAHPQYLLRSGGRITGDIQVDPGVKIGGVAIVNHDHDGVNSKKINGNNIEWGSISEVNIDTQTSTTSIPSNVELFQTEMSLIGPGTREIEARIKFDVSTENIVGYEFEILRLD